MRLKIIPTKLPYATNIQVLIDNIKSIDNKTLNFKFSFNTDAAELFEIGPEYKK